MKNQNHYINTLSVDDHIKSLYGNQREEAIGWVRKKYSLDTNSAIDVYQSSILIYYEKLIAGEIDTSRGPSKAFLFGIIKNKSLEQLRDQKKHMAQSINDTYRNQEDITDKQELETRLTVVADCSKKLSSNSNKIIRLFYFEKKSISEITSELGYKNEDTTKNIKYKSIQRLKRFVKVEMENLEFNRTEKFLKQAYRS